MRHLLVHREVAQFSDSLVQLLRDHLHIETRYIREQFDWLLSQCQHGICQLANMADEGEPVEGHVDFVEVLRDKKLHRFFINKYTAEPP